MQKNWLITCNGVCFVIDSDSHVTVSVQAQSGFTVRIECLTETGHDLVAVIALTSVPRFQLHFCSAHFQRQRRCVDFAGGISLEIIFKISMTSPKVYSAFWYQSVITHLYFPHCTITIPIVNAKFVIFHNQAIMIAR